MVDVRKVSLRVEGKYDYEGARRKVGFWTENKEKE